MKYYSLPLLLLLSVSLTGCSLFTVRTTPLPDTEVPAKPENNADTEDTVQQSPERKSITVQEEQYPYPVTFSYPEAWTADTSQDRQYVTPDGTSAYMLQGVSILGSYTPEDFYNQLKEMYAESYEISYSDDTLSDFTTSDGIPAKIGRIEMTHNHGFFATDVLIVPQKNAVLTFGAQCKEGTSLPADLRELTNTAEIQFGTEDVLTGNTFIAADNSELCLHPDGTFLYYQYADNHDGPYYDGTYEVFRGQAAFDKITSMTDYGLTEEELERILSANMNGYQIGGSSPADAFGFSDKESYVICKDTFYAMILHNDKIVDGDTITEMGADTLYIGYYIEELQLADMLNANTANYAQFSLQSTSEEAGSTNTVSEIFDHVYGELDVFVKDEDFLALDAEEKQTLLIPMLDTLVEDGYISEYHFDLTKHPAIMDFQFTCGGLGACLLEEYPADEN